MEARGLSAVATAWSKKVINANKQSKRRRRPGKNANSSRKTVCRGCGKYHETQFLSLLCAPNYSLKASWCAEQLFKTFEKIPHWPRRSTVLSDISGKISISEVSYRILFSVVFFYALFYLHGVIHDQSCTMTFQLALVHSSRPQTNTTGILPRMTRAQCQKVQSDLLYTRASKHSIDRPISAAKLCVFDSVTQISTYLKRSKIMRLFDDACIQPSISSPASQSRILMGQSTRQQHSTKFRWLHSGETPGLTPYIW